MAPSTDRSLPLAGQLAWWGTAWLAGRVGPDDLLDAVTAEGDVAPVVLGPGTTTSLLAALAEARDRGAVALAAAFPAPGDPVGLRGDRELTAAAIDAGEAVLLLGADRALVPAAVGRVVEWTSYAADRRPPLDLGEADRGLRAALLEAAAALAALDVAHWRPEVADELHDLRAGAPLAAPPGTPERCIGLAGRAVHLAAVVELALADDGGALSSADATARRAALDPLDRAVRRALTAACSPDGWPPAR